MSQIKNKTRKDIASEIIAILLFVLLQFFFKTCSAEFNEALFKRQAEELHLKDPNVLKEYEKILDVKKELDTCLKYDPVFDSYLTEICNNIVGNTMLRLLVANVRVNPPKSRLEVVLGRGKERNAFSPADNKIRVNLDLYKDGIKKTEQCGINKKGEPVERRSHIAESLFHELCHAFHYISAKGKTDSVTLEYIYKGDPEYVKLWKKDEELFNITGKFYDGTDLCFDPINCNMFDICYSCTVGRPIIQRMFHRSKNHKNSLPNEVLETFPKLLINVPDYLLTKN